MQICGNPFTSKSCAKTFLIKIFPKNRPDLSILSYAILDDQSNCSLAKSKFFDVFNEHGPEIPYSLSSCAGTTRSSGRKADGYSIQPLDNSTTIEIRSLIECNDIPDHRDEISTSEVAQFSSFS